MPDINDYIMNPASVNTSPEMLDREQILQGWNRELASTIAKQEQLTLIKEHWLVIEYLQKYFVQYGWPQSSHELSRKLDNAFAEQGGKRYLYQLFPHGPLTQGCRIAGLPLPHNTENRSFGSVQ